MSAPPTAGSAPAGETSPPGSALVFLEKLKDVDRKIQRFEVGVCVGALGVMVLLAFCQVFLRQVSGVRLGGVTLPQPVPWFDLVARYMVIWVGVLGASLATAEGRHISIEAAPKLLGAGGRRRLELLVDSVSLFVTGLLLALSLVYLLKIRVPEKLPLFTLEMFKLKVFSWYLLVVVPIALGLICWRFALRLGEGVLYDDEAHAKLRQELSEREVYELEAKVQEDEEVGLLVDVASSSGIHTAPTPEEAREEVRAVLKSDRTTVEAIRDQLARSGSGSKAVDVDDLIGEESSEDDIPLPDPDPQAKQPPRRVSFKSTDEIPVYTDLSDDDDLMEPEHRRGAPPVLDSSDELDSVTGMEDLLSAAQDELRAEAASTARMEKPEVDDDEPEDASEEDEPLPPTPDTTARVEVELPSTSSSDAGSSEDATPSDEGATASDDAGAAASDDEGATPEDEERS